MATPSKIRFFLRQGEDGDLRLAHPTWSGELAFETSQEKDQMFFRQKLAGPLTFQQSDFDYINAAPFDTRFRVFMQRYDGTAWLPIGPSLGFVKTDVEFDADRKWATVTPESKDIYDEILAGLEKEFNLIDLEPLLTPITYRNQAVLQVALPGASFIANFLDGTFWEQPVSAPLVGADPTAERTNHNNMIDLYGFGVAETGGTFDYARAVVTGSGLSVDVTGTYDGFSYLSDGFDQGVYRRLDDAYRVQQQSVAGGFRLELSVDGGATLFVSATHPDNDILIAPFHEGITLTNISDPTETVELFIFRPYVRLLTRETSVGGTATVALPDDDPFPHGSFTHALPVSTFNFLYSDGHGNTPTRWGKIDEAAQYYAGQYFTRPASPNGSVVMPVLNTTWKGVSAWFYFDATLLATQEAAGRTVTIQHAYKLADVINKLLEAITDQTSHEEAAAYSDFLYADGTNPIRGIKKTPIIVPKSNVLVGDYDQPQSKANIRLSEVLELCRNFHYLLWHIGESGFQLEHYQYYHNGKSYTAPQIGKDLTTLKEGKTGKAWAYRTNKWKFEKQDIPERIEQKWMDSVSVPFEGYPIEMLSGYAESGKIEQQRVTKFTSDIDFLNVSGETASRDGFVFFEAVLDGDDYVVPFVEIEIGPEESYKLQNGYASFLWAHKHYRKHGLPTDSVLLNKANVTASSVLRSKVQEFEMGDPGEIDPMELITTGLGNGRVERLKEKVAEGSVEVKVRHDVG